jgi:ComEC/Rec2-related protein
LAAGAAIVMGVWLGPLAIPIVILWLVVTTGLGGHVDWRFAIVIGVSVVVGLVRGMVATDLDYHPDVAESSGALIEVKSLPRPGVTGDTIVALVQTLETDEVSTPVSPFLVMVRLPPDTLAAPGDVLQVGWSATTLSVLPPGYADYLSARGVTANARVWWVDEVEGGPPFYRAIVSLRSRITEGIQDVLPGDAGALAAGIVTGDDSGLSEEARQAFLNTGTSHITAVSGSNVAMVLALWNLVIPAGRYRRLLVVQILIVATIWLYAFLVGLEPSAVRAALVASLGLFAVHAGRRPDLVTLLAITAASMVLWEPALTGMVSFWLSVVASVAICLRVPTTGQANWRSAARGMLEGVLLAQVATLPLILVWFGTWSLTSVVGNLLLLPLMWLAFPLSFVLAMAVLVIPGVAPILAVVPLVPLAVSLEIVRALAMTLPPADLESAGPAAIVAIAVPCLLIAAALSVDARRMRGIASVRWQTQPLMVAVTLVAPMAGIMAALIVSLVTG